MEQQLFDEIIVTELKKVLDVAVELGNEIVNKKKAGKSITPTERKLVDAVKGVGLVVMLQDMLGGANNG